MRIPKEDTGSKIRNKLVLPKVVLLLFLQSKKVTKKHIREALESLNEAVELSKQCKK